MLPALQLMLLDPPSAPHLDRTPPSKGRFEIGLVLVGECSSLSGSLLFSTQPDPVTV